MDELIQDFVFEMCFEDETVITKASDIHKAFINWYQENFGSRYPSGVVIRKFFSDRYKIYRSCAGGLFYRGIGLKVVD